ncbi:hypothetical protein SNK04_004113 [Fusarium graminearum]
MLLNNLQHLLNQQLDPLPLIRQRRWSLISEDGRTMVRSMSASTITARVEITTTVVAVTSPSSRLAHQVIRTVGRFAYALAGT